MTAGPLIDDLWDDWKPVEQTALDFLLVVPQMKLVKAVKVVEKVRTDSDSDWAPEIQGAANVEKSEEEALKVLLQPNFVKETPPESLQTKKEADAAGRMLHEMRRPPTWEEVKAEIPRGPDVDPDLIEAPSYRDMSQEEALDLVRRGASVNFQGQHGRTPLHKAAEKAFPVLIKALCEARADPDSRDHFGETPLHVLAKSGHDEAISKSRRCEAIQMLLCHGADVHAVNPRGRGVLHLAVTEHDLPAIETLIEGMADVNGQDLAGFTPLMWAAGRDSADGVKMLLDCEADLLVKAARGQTAMTFALTNGCNAIVDILDKHQAILDAEEARRIKEKGEQRDEDLEENWTETLQLPKPEWACKHEKPANLEPYAGRRIYAEAKPDRHSNVYVGKFGP
ncbi:Putative ankyrin repeat protein FPV244 [Durusdinium trenchii]|uniref:Ankyrin repeat protein FPV244 n=1 Tax=Durusdinium trenchii TaxID=1381693 RepID=A0ABP0I804_9DINO